MGSKRSVKAKKKLLDTDPLKKDQDVDVKKSQQARMSWKLKYELINSDQYSNGMSEDGKESSEEEESNSGTKTPNEAEEKKMEMKRKETKQKTTVIAGLSGYLSSSDSGEDSSDQDVDINGEVQAFLKEVDAIKLDSNGNPIEENNKKKGDQKPPSEAAAIDQQQQAMREYYAAHGYAMPTTSWQECFDSSSGYSYYWNMESNEVRWEIPAEYQSYISNVKQQWEEYHRALYRNQYNNSSLGQASVPISQTPAVHSSSLQATNSLAASLHTAAARKDLLNPTANRALPDISPTKSTPPLTTRRKRPPNMSDSEDEKIELITSYGPNSDDQSSEDEKSSPSDPKKIKKRKSRHSHGSREEEYQDKPYVNSKLSHVPDKGPPGVEDDPDEMERQEEIRRRLASRQEDMKKLFALKKEEALRNKKRAMEAQKEGPAKKKQVVESEAVNVASSSSEESQEVPKISHKPDLPSDTDVPSPGEAELVERLKSQAEVLKKLGGELPEGVTRIISEQLSKPDPKGLSLVAGYDEEADSETDDRDSSESSDKAISEVKAVKQECSKESGTKSGEVKEEKAKVEVKAAGERVSKQVLKLSAKAKKLINASETTKRARQTDFVNTPHGLRPANSSDIDEDKSNLDPETMKRTGLGSTAEASDKLKPGKLVQPVSVGSTGKELGDFSDSGLEFDIKDCSELLLNKMKFLSEGKDQPSPVQIWSEQLEILYKAWEGKHLKSEFLSRWLQSIDERLSQLESSAVPLGWLCLWSREERRYYYKKVETGEVVWDFPVESGGMSVDDPVGEAKSQEDGGEECLDLGEGQGEVEMELCMTPPPPPTPPSPPPPPSISDRAPTPPPPPIISFSSDGSLPDDAPPLPEETPPPLPEEAPPPLPEEAPPLPLEEAPPLPPGEPLPPGVEPPSSSSYPAPTASPTPAPAPAPLPASPQPAPTPPATPTPPQSVAPPLSHRALLPHPPPPQVQPDYGHMVLAPAPYHHMGYHQIHFATQSQYSSAYVSAAPMPAHVPPKVTEAEKKGDLISELDSFYSDLATLEPEESDEQVQETVPSGSALAQTTEEVISQPPDSPEPPPTSSSPDPAAAKKKKKPKLAPGLALKKKGVSSLVAKWQKVQQSARRDF